jgi:adenine-specific DNA-methyltransferase
MKLYETLEKQLKNEPNWVSDNEELKKWVVIDRARNYDPELIKLLLQEPKLKATFFVEVEGTLVFKQEHFITFMEMKNYLNDSYTQYKNKVGLTIGGKYLKQRNEVALVWPFKDCILEGGQSREEQKREEIFFNEILAQDEITQLLEPKVLTNAKVFDKDGEHAFSGFTRDAELNRKRGLPENTITDNLIIKGNNLLALHSLKKEFAGKVKLIYIDPPYYFSKTSKNVDSFTYNSSFKLSTWLVFLKNRLIEAKFLLKNEGLIFVSIDDGGQAHLKVLMDEIFGTENFIANLPTIMNLKGNNDEFGFAGTHEYTLVYAKSKANAIVYEFPVDAEEQLKSWEEDAVGYYKKGANLKATGTNAPRSKRPNLFYPIFINSENEVYVTDDNKPLKPTDTKLLPITDGTEMSWRWQKKKVKNEPFNIIVSKNEGNFSLYKKQRPELGELPSKKPKTIFYKPEYSSGNGTAQIKELFGEKVFSNPKPLELIKDFVLLGSGENDIVLDFHAGSGTIGHAVLDLLKDDNCPRQFIMVEQMDYIETVTKERIQKVIKRNGVGESVYLELKKYNQTFMEQIEEAQDTETLLQIWEQMKAKSFLNYNVDIKKQEEHIEDFKALSLKEQKQHLCELLDKNQLYVNLSSLNDKDFECTEEEKKVTKDFYQIKEK